MYHLYLVYDKKLVSVERSDNYIMDEFSQEPRQRYPEIRDYSFSDVPHGRQSVLWVAFSMYNSDKEVKRKIDLPTWSSEEEASIRTRCENDIRSREHPYEVTEEMVLDRYYKHDPETGERTDEPTGEFPSIEACRQAMEQEAQDEYESRVANLTEDLYKATMEACLVAPEGMATFESRPEIQRMLQTKKIRIFHMSEKDANGPWPLTDTQLDYLEEQDPYKLKLTN